MSRNAVPHPGKTLALFAGLAVLMFMARHAHSAEAVPFGAHSFTYASHIKPSTATQAALDTATSTFYTNWKNAYYLAGCGAGQGRINYDGANQTVSEAHGYGMLIFVLMAGYDSGAHANFDAMYQFYKAHPAAGANRLLAWKQNASCANIEGDDTASDGDLDVALSLLMADRQWGSCGSINYKAEGVAMINQLKAQDLNSTYKYVKLGNWATSGNYLNSTRSSDFMPGHYRSFQWATGDTSWTTLINHTYYLVTATANATTGLLPDFISNPITSPSAAPANFLESANDGDYNWNACRDPWRLGTDYIASGDARAYAAVQKLVTWAKGAPINGNANNVRAGYQLNGTQLVSYGDRAFTVPFAVAAMADASNQTFLNSFWGNAQVGGTAVGDYFGDSIKMLCMIVLSGNWWTPEAMPDPCNLGTPTPTRTPSRTPSPTSGTGSSTASPTAAAATPTQTRTVTPTATRTSTPVVTPTATTAPSSSCPIVLAYYTSWNPAYKAANIPYSKLTHICHAFIMPNADGSLNVPAGLLEPALLTNAHANGVKVLISVGGATGSGNFSTVANNASIRASFVSNLKAWILANNYDGVDFDWEFPESAADRTAFTLLVSDIRTSFNSAPNAHPEWLISGAYSWTDWYAQWYDLAALTPLVDFFNVMTYDAHGPWSPHSGHNAPLGAAAGDSDAVSMQAVISYYNTTRGVPLNKLNFGVPFYGYRFPLEDLHQACNAGCQGGTISLPYNAIAPLVGAGWTRVWDASASSPKLTLDSGAQVITYDDPQSIQAKANWALNTKGLRGVFMWDLSNDHLGGGNQPLLDAMRAPIACGASPTGTPSRTTSRTPTGTPSATMTRTASPSMTSSASPTATPSSSRTSTPSASPSAILTASRTATASASPSATRTASVTVTQSGTPSASPSISPTYTDVPVGSSPTSTSTATPTVTQTGTASASPSVTPTSTQSPVDTATATPTLSPANSATPSATQSATRTATSTLTLSPVHTATRSATAAIPTSTATPSLSPANTQSSTPTSTVSPAATATVSPTAVPTADNGPLLIHRVRPYPNPGARELRVELEGPAETIRVRLYTAAWVLLGEAVTPVRTSGWQTAALPDPWKDAGPGLYYVSVQALRGSVQSPLKKATLYKL